MPANQRQVELSRALAAKVAAATVRLPTKGGQGVLVHGLFVLTAAHCVESDGDGSMADGERYYFEEVETPSGAKFRMQVCAVELVADIAVLAVADGQVLYNDCEKAKTWIGVTAPVPLRAAGVASQRPVPIHVLTHRGTWVRGTVTQTSPERASEKVAVATDGDIQRGTSGGPIVDSSGALVGVVSVMSGGKGSVEGQFDGGHEGECPVAAFALPAWVLASIRSDRRRMDARDASAHKVTARGPRTPVRPHGDSFRKESHVGSTEDEQSSRV